MSPRVRAHIDRAIRDADLIPDAGQKHFALVLISCASAVCEEISENVGPLPPTLARFEREFALSLQAT